MAKIGPGIAGGNNRQALTDADAEGRALFQRWCQDLGCTVAHDSMGNMFAVRAGTDPNAAPVYMGSHLDTQPTGGKYDGVLGVLGALEVMQIIAELDVKTKHPIAIANWSNEEGTRFAPALLGSGVFAGVYDQSWAYGRKDSTDKTFGDELARIGWQGDEPVGIRKMHAYYELHIEQGPILEAQGKDIGVVIHGQGLIWLQITIQGKASHTGSTPMAMRKNAGLAMARVIEKVDQIALSHAPNAVGAVGHLEVTPNSRNVIPETAIFTVDFRSPDASILQDMEAKLRQEAQQITGEMGLTISFENAGQYAPVSFDPACVTTVRQAAKKLGYAHMDLISGAGHDACWINQICPTAMIMCPCVDGLSHNEAEKITPAWAAAGTNTLLHTVLETAQITS
jgi:N-carbamoyl-L-amino-acid hydrolase